MKEEGINKILAKIKARSKQEPVENMVKLGEFTH
jgi:hypothetical protein